MGPFAIHQLKIHHWRIISWSFIGLRFIGPCFLDCILVAQCHQFQSVARVGIINGECLINQGASDQGAIDEGCLISGQILHTPRQSLSQYSLPR